MPNVITFTPRPRSPVAPPAAELDLRTYLEEAAQTALDAADKIIAALDRIEDGAVIEGRSAPAAITAEPIRPPEPVEIPTEEADETQEAEPEITSTPIPEPIILPEPIESPPPLRWSGAGNIISATGIALFSLMAVGARS